MVSTPYHIYNGYGLFIGGTADYKQVKRLISNEDMLPVQTDAGQALMGIWVCDFTEASLGQHHELQFSFFVAPQDVPPVRSHPFATLVTLLARRDIKMMCHGLWNNTPTVVAYNRELLGLNAVKTSSRVERDQRKVDCTFDDEATGARIFSGSIKTAAGLSAGFSLIAGLGIASYLNVARQPWQDFNIVNPKGAHSNRNVTAKAYAKSQVNVFRFFDATDMLKIEHPAYQPLNFAPQVVQYTDGYKFVYMLPE